MSLGTCRDQLTLLIALVLRRWQVVERTVQPPVVVPVDPLERGQFAGFRQNSDNDARSGAAWAGKRISPSLAARARRLDRGPAKPRGLRSDRSCATCARVPTRRAPTARRSASSRRCCAVGRTGSPTRRAHPAVLPENSIRRDLNLGRPRRTGSIEYCPPTGPTALLILSARRGACHVLSAAPSCESHGCVDGMLSVGFISCGRGSRWHLDEMGDVESATVRTIGESRRPVGRRARVHVSTAVLGGSSQTTSLHLVHPAA